MHGKHATFDLHSEKMRKAGEWGTDLEIAAAAALFSLNIVVWCQYGDHYDFQVFTANVFGDCADECPGTIYLVNTSGHRYNMAIVV
jgi:hypothetical protein